MTYSLRYGYDVYTIDMDGNAAQVMDTIIDRARTTGLSCGLVFKSSPHHTFFSDPMSPELEGASWQAIGEWLYAKLPPSARQLKAFVAQALLRPSIQEPVEAAFTVGVEATLRARIATLEDQRNDASRRLTAANDELVKFRTERNSFNVRDKRMCERIQKAEARIRELEAEGVPALIGQRDAWRDIAQKLNTILCNQDPSHV